MNKTLFMKWSRDIPPRKSGPMLGVWLSTKIVQAIDRAASNLDLDRAKFMRQALREKLAKKSQESDPEN